MFSTLRRMALPLLLAAAAPASAGVIAVDGVSFTSSFTGNVLSIEIDALGHTGSWKDAYYLDAFSIKTGGSFSAVTMSSSTGAGSWTMLGAAELGAKVCNDAGEGKEQSVCFSGTPIRIGDDMRFTLTFEGAPGLEAPHLKVRFLDASGKKAGDLLSQYFPLTAETLPPGGGKTGGEQTEGGQPGEIVETGGGGQAGAPAEVPEPQSLVLLAGGLGVLGLALRRRRAPRA